MLPISRAALVLYHSTDVKKECWSLSLHRYYNGCSNEEMCRPRSNLFVSLDREAEQGNTLPSFTLRWQVGPSFKSSTIPLVYGRQPGFANHRSKIVEL